MNFHLAILVGYSLALMALGLWVGRRVRGAADFFVAGRSLGPGLIFSTMLAANIGAGSTVGVVGRIGRDRIDCPRVLDRPGNETTGRGTSAAHGRRLSRASVQRVGAQRRCCHSLDRIAVHPRRPALGDRLDHQRRHGRGAMDRLPDRRRRHHGVLHCRRSPDVRVGERRPAHGEDDWFWAGTAAGGVGAGQRRGQSAGDSCRLLPNLADRLAGPVTARDDCASVYRLARPVAEDLWRS